MKSTETMVQWSKGNMGAASFLMDLHKPENQGLAFDILSKLDRLESLRGTNIYILYSDLCDKNMVLVHRLCATCPDTILEDACSRQDYSGKKLVEMYL